MAATALAGPAAAEATGLFARQVDAVGMSQAEGQLGLLHMAGRASAIHAFSLDAVRLRATQFNTSSTEIDVGDGIEDENTAALLGGDFSSVSYSGANVHAAIADRQTMATVHAYGTPRYAAEGDKLVWTAINDPILTPERIEGNAVGGDADPEPDRLRQPWLDGHFPLARSKSTTLTLTIIGDFVLEVIGLDLQFGSPSGQQTLESGVVRQPLAPGSAVPAYSVDTKLIRVVASGAALRITLVGPSMVCEWTDMGKAQVSTAAGYVGFAGAAGQVDAHGRTIIAEDGEALVYGPVGLTLAPLPGRLGIVPAAPADPSGTGATPVVPDGAAGLLAGAGLLALVLTVLALAANGRRRLTLRAVEAALEGGDYDRAASLAARLLARDPDQEDAAVARAVALTKGGHSARVVEEVTVRLRERKPTDGVLHYMLGLAYLELGRRGEAKAALAEAVRRTPALASDVAARLGGEATREVNAYA